MAAGKISRFKLESTKISLYIPKQELLSTLNCSLFVELTTIEGVPLASDYVSNFSYHGGFAKKAFFPAKLLEQPHEPVFVNFFLRHGSNDLSEQILAAMENLEHICYEVHLLTRKSFKLITEQESTIAKLKEELEQRKKEHKRKFQELLKESQKRIELIEGDSRLTAKNLDYGEDYDQLKRESEEIANFLGTFGGYMTKREFNFDDNFF
ncbi:Oidioi.mRNA.OKI2018_I69.XSR.g14740.t1.cds [Oikopleura dioica]|uniref:Oidioi.mRNA.OKI2018_I69.XSR.g14740.t1.cds n=1 Tax=Oikopleura dioica TaxID=34765 RepID=A0ABN7SEQ8_OIKDI|nr:Oidioi.mRNA.OKI2018_I69.XSR.g14740.t1.cds [Oikopleura dioica]